MATNSIKLLTGNSHPQLAKQVAARWVLFFFFFYGILGRVDVEGWEKREGGWKEA